MESMAQYLDLAKEATNSKSDSNLARKIDVTRTSVHDWRKGKSLPSADKMVELAMRANLDPSEALILLGLFKSHGETKAAYKRALKRLMCCVFALCLFGTGNIEARAKIEQKHSFSAVIEAEKFPSNPHTDYYEKY